MNNIKEYDIIVIGGGRASTLALEASKRGKRVALVERDKLGGTCPNRGCVPSKLLIGYADTAKRIRESARHYIKASIEQIDVEQMFSDVNEWIGAVDARYESRFPSDLTLYRGEGKFISNKVVEVNGVRLTAKHIVIATGSRPRPHPFPQLPIWTSDDLFPFEHKIPQDIVIVGGGFIACELANFFHSVGINTTLLVRGERLLSAEDDTISDIFKEEFSEYVPTKFNTTISDASHNGEKFQLTLLVQGEEMVLETDAVLYATGRIPNTDSLGLENTDIVLDQRGFVERNEFLETSVEGVYATGDIGGDHQLQHAASAEVSFLSKRLLGDVAEDESWAGQMMPHAVFTDPEIASVGITEQQLEQNGYGEDEVVIVTKDWSSSARALSWKMDYPGTKLIVRKSDYAILGCHMIGPESSTMIHQVLAVMQLNNDIRKIAEMIHIHPSLSESLLAIVNELISKIEA